MTKQNYSTPNEFILAVKRRFGDITWDLAASEHNTKALLYFSEAQDSLKQDWDACTGLCWLNPPFKHIEPWVKKARGSTAHILMLVPASVSTNWFRDHVYGTSGVYALNPRIHFEGVEVARNFMLLEYNGPSGFALWVWK